MFDNYAYAKYELVPDISYNIISHLIKADSAEIIWKLLKDNSNNAWSIGNVSQEEKRKMIYDGSEFASDFNVFIDSGMDDAITEEKTYLRIYPYYGTPTTRSNGIIDIAFEIMSHYKINTLSNYRTRTDTILQSLLETLNGVDIGGVGFMFFDTNGSRSDKFQSIGISPYKGKMLVMSVNIG